jgi:hypothetical protein
MGGREKKRCVYCGSSEKLSKDHIPPKCLYSKPYPANLITVPSCEACRKKTTLDDEYFRYVYVQKRELAGHPDVKKLKTILDTSLKRTENAGFQKMINERRFKTLEVTPSKEHSQLVVGRRVVKYMVDPKRIRRVVSRINLGFFIEKQVTRFRRISFQLPYRLTTSFRCPRSSKKNLINGRRTLNDNPKSQWETMFSAISFWRYRVSANSARCRY